MKSSDNSRAAAGADSGSLERLLEAVEQLNRFRHLSSMLDYILSQSRGLSNAEAGTIFLVEDGGLRFSYVQNDVLFAAGRTPAELYANLLLPMDDGSIVGHVARSGEPACFADVYKLPAGSGFSFNQDYDRRSGYRTRSVLAIPFKDRRGRVAGVLQLINARRPDGGPGEFSAEAARMVRLLAVHAAGAIGNAMASREMVLRMMRVAELRDPKETGAHVQRVSCYAGEIYRRLIVGRLDPMAAETEDLLRLGAMLHDVGKTGISDAILKKPGKLTDEEFAIMRTHTTLGAAMFVGEFSELDAMCRDIALCHHERWDGKGYPCGRRGEDIPLAARITALADVFDALSSRRVYKEAWDPERAFALIAAERGAQFDPSLVDVFMDIRPLLLAIRERYTE